MPNPWMHQAPDSIQLKHLPGSSGLPLVGHTLRFIREPLDVLREAYSHYGSVSRFGMAFQQAVLALGPEFVHELTLDRERNFSARLGYDLALGKLFEGGLLLRDFDDHRFHRRLMQTAFKSAAMQGYQSVMSPLVEREVAKWQHIDRFHFYPQTKMLALDIACNVFVGVDDSRETERLKKAFKDLMVGVMAIFRFDLPGLAFHQGMRGRRELEHFFTELVAHKRRSGGSDMMSYFCRERTEEGEFFSPEQVAEQMIFLVLAAHDTTTSVLSNAMHMLALYPEEQERLREEALAMDKTFLEWSDLEQLGGLDCLFKETMRLFPPVVTMLRRTVRDCQLGGFEVAANSVVMVSPLFTQRMEDLWPQPDHFKPRRFEDKVAEAARPLGSWAPFGGGAHKCIGMHFADMLFKTVMYSILRHYRFELPNGYRSRVQFLPFPKPADDLPLKMIPLSRVH